MNKILKYLISAFSENHFKYNQCTSIIYSGNLHQMHENLVILLHFILHYALDGRFRFLAVRDPEATSRFQIGSIDLYARAS